ncbi:MAG: thermosome subunit beta [Candidatus Hodarchaeales archaeon]|jgi:thermosome
MMQLGGQPVIILKEGTERSRGRDAQRNNIQAAIAVADAVRSALGPRGMDKLLVDSLGDVVITNDGATILDEIDVQHPAAKMLVQVAKVQDQEVGDGTTTSVIVAGELLKRAEKLLDLKIHPTVIIGGFKLASDKCTEILQGIAIKVDPEDDEILKSIAKTSLNSKSVGGAKELLSSMAVDATRAVKENNLVDLDMISIIQKQGKSLTDSELIRGLVIDKEVVNNRMPDSVENPKIALIDVALEIKKTEFDAKIRITEASMMDAFLDQEQNMIQEMVDQIKGAEATVVMCQKGIDDLAQHFLAKEGIMAIRRVKKSDMEKLSRATGAKVVTNLKDLSSEDLGTAGIVEEVQIGDEKLMYVRDCPNPKSVSIVLRGGTKYVTDEAERALHDALCVVRDVLEDGWAVAGAGSPEVELHKGLKEFAGTVKGREQMAVDAFADAVEIIPRTLAENAGLDSIDVLVELRAAHEKGNTNTGINVDTGKNVDAFKAGIIEPLRVKRQALRSAREAAELILRIDDVIQSKSMGGAPGGMPPGMGGMPPGMGGMPPMM